METGIQFLMVPRFRGDNAWIPAFAGMTGSAVIYAAGCRAAVSLPRKFRFKNKLVSLDSTVIDLCVSLFDWALFRRTKGAIKLHLVLDHDGYLPSFAVVTEGMVADVKVAQGLSFEPGTVVVDDRGYNDDSLFARWTAAGVYFVTRMKDNALYEVVDERPVPQHRQVLDVIEREASDYQGHHGHSDD